MSSEILSRDALAFLQGLHRRFEPTRRALIAARHERQARLDDGEMPTFLPETDQIRRGDWQVDPVPPDLEDRRVEITGPVERKMIINALNSGARVFMADFEDSNTPSWENIVEGQRNLMDAVRGTIEMTSPEGKHYALKDNPATLMVRPRGWHLVERNLEVDGAPISASLADFGLYVFHNARVLIEQGSGPYFYLPKLESHLEARLWNEVFTDAQATLGIPVGSIKATVLIETIVAAFEMEEILYELRNHSAGLNAGRWDYIFSAIKKFRNRPSVLPERGQITMTVPFMRAYTEQMVRACHRRGAHAIGGMAAFIPNRRDPEVTERALAAVRADKQREAADGFDGTWVAHPDLVPVAMETFDEVLGDRPSQLHRLREDVRPDTAGLLDLRVPGGSITEAGLRLNVSVGIEYLASWLRGNGAAAINDLMEDAATAEISRSQIWHWVHHGAQLDDGSVISGELIRRVIEQEVGAALSRWPGEPDASRIHEAAHLFAHVALDEPFVEFLTLPAYDLI